MVRMVESMTKWAYQIERVADLPHALRRAIKVATTPPTGPVFLGLPMDIMMAEADLDVSAPSRIAPRLRGDLEAMQRAADLLAKAQHPLILVGDEVAKADALDELVAVAEALGASGRVSPWVVLRWSTQPAALPDAGEWVDSAHPVLPEWLRPFPGPVLVTLDADGRYLAGVGVKRHTRWGQELAVGTEPEARGRGLARRLVAQAGRKVLAGGAVPLYVHDPNNAPSAHVADAAGFPDRGWRLLAVWGG
jgi:GNAT superfamily N-acetyltransferase